MIVARPRRWRRRPRTGRSPHRAVWIDYGKGSHSGTSMALSTRLPWGFGVGVAGHAPPRHRRGGERSRKGTHFAQPTEDAIMVAEELRARYGLPQWRYNNSGTESTMDAFHLMRVATVVTGAEG